MGDRNVGGRSAPAGRAGAVVVTLVCVAMVVASLLLASGGSAPAVTMRQSGHWVFNRTTSSVLHIDGGTRRADAGVEVPDAPAEPLFAVQGNTQGFLVAMDRVVVFGKSTLTVDSTLPISFSEVPVPIEVAGGPYLVYREAGTIVRLGRPPVFIQAGGRLGRPVWSDSGTVWVQRLDSGALCVLRPDADALDCTLQAPESPGGLTVTGGLPAFVATGPDAAQLLDDSRLGPAVGLGTDLAADGLIADRDTGGKLAVVDPAANRLQIADTSGVPAGVPGGPGTVTDLGPGRFTSPVAAEGLIVVLDELANRVLAFDPAGALLKSTKLPEGSGPASITRGEDGRIYVDDEDGAAVHIVERDGAVSSVPTGGPRAAGQAGAAVVPVAAPAERRAIVAIPTAGTGRAPVPWRGAGLQRPRSAAAAGPTAPGAPLTGAPLPGGGPPLPDQPPLGQPPAVSRPSGSPPPANQPPVGLPPGNRPPVQAPPVIERPPPPVPSVPVPPPPITVDPQLPPEAPTGVQATAHDSGDVDVSWSPVDGGGRLVTYEVLADGVFVSASNENRVLVHGLEVGRPYTFTVRATTSVGTGAESAPSAAVTPYLPAGPPGGLTVDRTNISGYLMNELTWAAADLRGGTFESYEIRATGGIEDATGTVDSLDWMDGANGCSPSVTYEVRALTLPPLGGELLRGEPARFTLDTPIDCTPDLEITSATVNAQNSIMVEMRCTGYHRGGTGRGEVSLRFDGKERWSDECVIGEQGDNLTGTVFAVVDRLLPATEYSIQAVISSASGSKTTDTVTVRTPDS